MPHPPSHISTSSLTDTELRQLRTEWLVELQARRAALEAASASAETEPSQILARARLRDVKGELRHFQRLLSPPPPRPETLLDRVHAACKARGITLTQWARVRGYHGAWLIQVLQGRGSGVRGLAIKAEILQDLGIEP